MGASTDVKARLLDLTTALTTAVLELTRDGQRNAVDVCRVLQVIKDDPFFTNKFFKQTEDDNVWTQLKNWKFFYWLFFGIDIELNISEIRTRVHLQRPGFTRLILVAQGLTPNRVFGICQKHFPCWRYIRDLDSVIDWSKEERNPQNNAYVILVRDTQEADENLKNLSANQVQKKGITTETLTECLLHHLKYWSETKEHLDTENITLCSGSRHQDGHVPGVGWGGGKLSVSWYDPGSSHDFLRSREAVS